MKHPEFSVYNSDSPGCIDRMKGIVSILEPLFKKELDHVFFEGMEKNIEFLSLYFVDNTKITFGAKGGVDRAWLSVLDEHWK